MPHTRADCHSEDCARTQRHLPADYWATLFANDTAMAVGAETGTMHHIAMALHGYDVSYLHRRTA